jgi:sporulation protein YlmC with PRC-barrel domain
VEREVLLWGVASTTPKLDPGALAGTYVGATAEAAWAVGMGANVLVGGSKKGVALQPIAIEGLTGANVAAGVTEVELKTSPAGTARRTRESQQCTEKGLTMNGKGGRSLAALVVAGLIVAGSAGKLGAQVAGSTTIGVSVEEIKAVALGWSAKKKILGKAVYNEKNEKIGVVDDLIITPDKSVSYAIIGAGGFLGMGKHDVAIPVGQFKEDKGRIVLAGASKDALKAMPKFEYAK